MELCVGKSMSNFLGWKLIKHRKTSFDEVTTGDVILVKGHDKKLYAHRIISIHQKETPPYDYVLTTKGDNFKESKPYEIDLPPENIIGLIYWALPPDDIVGEP